MAVNFPDSPTNGQEITVGTITYSYDSSKGVWVDVASVGASTPRTVSVFRRGSTVSVSLTNSTIAVVARSGTVNVGVN